MRSDFEMLFARACGACCLLASIASGCRALPPSYVFACDDDAQCPPGQACDLEKGLCSDRPRSEASAQTGTTAGAGTTARRASSAGTSANESSGAGAGAAAESSYQRELATLGAACDRQGSNACAALATPQLLRCDGQKWVDDGECPPQTVCGYATRDTRCADVAKECLDRKPGAKVCYENNVHACHDDLTFSKYVVICAGLLDKCQDGQCVCGSMCGSECVDLKSNIRHCGACNHSCEVGCMSSGCLPVEVTSLTGMGHEIAVDAESVYWSEADLGALRKVGLAGGAITTLATASTITSFVLVPNGIMFVQNREQLAVIPRSGGTGLLLGRIGSSDALASDEVHVYYACIPSGAANESLCKLPVRGGTPITLVPNARVAAIAVHGSEVFWIQENAIFKVSTAGGTPTMLLPASTMLAPTIAADATHVYWIESTSRDLRRVARSGGAPELFSDDATANVIETDGSSVYWLAGFSIVAKRVTDTSPGSIIGTVPYVVSAAIDSKYIYALQRDATTNRIAKVERSIEP